MTTDEKLAALAAALLHLARNAARTWDYDGETRIGEGVELPSDLERALEAIVKQQEAKK